MLFYKHNEKTETDKDKLKRQYNTLDDSEKLKWIQKAITAYEVSLWEFVGMPKAWTCLSSRVDRFFLFDDGRDVQKSAVVRCGS